MVMCLNPHCRTAFCAGCNVKPRKSRAKPKPKRVRINSKYGVHWVTLSDKAQACWGMPMVADKDGNEVTDPEIVDRVFRLFIYDRLQGYGMEE